MSKIIKIAFVGTSCIGKTSLLDMCGERIKGKAVFVSEAAREYFASHPEATNRFSIEVQGPVQALAFQKERLAYERVMRQGRAAIICDRSVLDAPIYVQSNGDDSGARTLLERALPWLHTYSRIYLLDPADIPFAQDSIRDESESVRQLIHQTFLDFLGAHGIPYTLLSGGLNERFSEVNDYLARQLVA